MNAITILIKQTLGEQVFAILEAKAIILERDASIKELETRVASQDALIAVLDKEIEELIQDKSAQELIEIVGEDV